MEVLAWAVLGYLFGSLPWSWVAAQLAGRTAVIDGASRDDPDSSAHRLLRRRRPAGAAVTATTLDVLKALVPVTIASLAAGPDEAAGCLVGAVAGHCWPPVLRRFAGRGLEAAAGGFLALLPVEVVLGGLIAGLISVGGRLRLAMSLGFLAVPLVATLRGQPLPLRVAAWSVLGMIVARRLEGVSREVSAGVPWRRAALRRAVFDSPAAAVMAIAGGASGDLPPRRPDLLERIFGRGGRRVVITIVGWAVLLTGFAMLIFPGPGLLVVAAGLAILATEYHWAGRALEWVRDRIHAARERARRKRNF